MDPTKAQTSATFFHLKGQSANKVSLSTPSESSLNPPRPSNGKTSDVGHQTLPVMPCQQPGIGSVVLVIGAETVGRDGFAVILLQ